MDNAPTPLKNDDDLAARVAYTSFNISRIFRYFLLCVSMALILLLAIVFCAAMVTNRTYRDGVNAQLKENIVGIVITSLAVVGINLDKFRKKE